MNDDHREPIRIDAIPTSWSLIREAHGDRSQVDQARHDFVLRYSPAIRAYVKAIMQHDPQSDEVAQDIVVKMLQGSLSGADPNRGRFRDFLKVVVRNMVRNYWSRENRRRSTDVEVNDLQLEEESNIEDSWDGFWRDELLKQTWQAMEADEQKKPGNLGFTILKLRAEFPEANSEQLAEQLGKRLGKPVRPDALRQKLRRARLQFAEHLLLEVAAGLEASDVANVEAELIDLGLYEQVRKLLPEDWKTRWFASKGAGGS